MIYLPGEIDRSLPISPDILHHIEHCEHGFVITNELYFTYAKGWTYKIIANSPQDAEDLHNGLWWKFVGIDIGVRKILEAISIISFENSSVSVNLHHTMSDYNKTQFGNMIGYIFSMVPDVVSRIHSIEKIYKK